MAQVSAESSNSSPGVIVGLGNPGEKYSKTRHNVGFEVVDALAARWRIPLNPHRKFQGIYGEGHSHDRLKVSLLKPQTYMNRSGESVQALLQWYKSSPASILVIYDDMDLALGRLRLRPSGSAGGHNGMKSIITHLGTPAFPRLRIGIGAADKATHRDRAVVAHVLGRPTTTERVQMDAVIQLAVETIEASLVKGIEKTMSLFNGITLDAEGKRCP
ncbi:MAG: aminoacyl-tRNA hydrolase [Leptolyngbya sp. RL_3_1]|nr:aminoacyl-tRNA hydrolase [Leptolyngbya sp. RL_3_1]